MIYVISILLVIITGYSNELPMFPSDTIYVVNPDTHTCSKHEIIKKDPITVGDGVDVAWNDCPHVFGFKDSDIGPVMNWVRKAQTIAKQKCKDI